MKKTEVAMTLLIASVAMIAAFFLTRSLFGSEIEREASVETTESIVKDNTNGISISRRVFNDQALNPTVEVYVNGDVDPRGVVDMEAIESSIVNPEE